MAGRIQIGSKQNTKVPFLISEVDDIVTHIEGTTHVSDLVPGKTNNLTLGGTEGQPIVDRPVE